METTGVQTATKHYDDDSIPSEISFPSNMEMDKNSDTGTRSAHNSSSGHVLRKLEKDINEARLAAAQAQRSQEHLQAELSEIKLALAMLLRENEELRRQNADSVIGASVNRTRSRNDETKEENNDETLRLPTVEVGVNDADERSTRNRLPYGYPSCASAMNLRNFLSSASLFSEASDVSGLPFPHANNAQNANSARPNNDAPQPRTLPNVASCASAIALLTGVRSISSFSTASSAMPVPRIAAAARRESSNSGSNNSSTVRRSLKRRSINEEWGFFEGIDE